MLASATYAYTITEITFLEEAMPRPSKGADAKRHILTMRVTGATRDRILAEADENGRSVTQEIESRLDRSLNQDDALGGAKTAAFLRHLASAIGMAEAASGQSWHDDYATWRAVSDLMPDLLKQMRPAAPNEVEIRKALQKFEEVAAESAADPRPKTAVERLVEAGTGRPMMSKEMIEAHRQVEQASEALKQAAADAKEMTDRLRAAMGKTDGA